MTQTATRPSITPRAIILPLALCQFIASYAASNMNVAIKDISVDIGTTVIGVQTTISLFTLTMAALMIPGSKLTDIWGRKRCFAAGLVIYGAGAIIAAAAPSIGVLTIGYSVFEGVGSALMIPPVYILLTVAFEDTASRAKAFGAISAAAGIGAAAGPLIGGLITTTISWRASFGLQALVVGAIVLLSRRIVDPGPSGERPVFDLGGAVLSAAGLLLIVLGFLASGSFGWFVARKDLTVGGTTVVHEGGVSPSAVLIMAGLLVLLWFYGHVRARERRGKVPLIGTGLFRNGKANLGLVTQGVQWLVLQGSFFVISVFFQEIRGYSAIETGLVLVPATIGTLGSSALAERMAKRRAQRTLVWGGFVATIVGLVLVLLVTRVTSSVFASIPGLFLTGIGIGVMLTASVNVVQSSFPESEQGEISGLSRSVSNLGSSLGTALVGSVLVSSLVVGNQRFAFALVAMVLIALVGLVAAILLPRDARAGTAPLSERR